MPAICPSCDGDQVEKAGTEYRCACGFRWSVTSHWLLRHPELPGACCLLSDRELTQLVIARQITADMDAEPINLVPFNEFLATARRRQAA